MEFLKTMFTTFFERHDPHSSIVNPVCMKNTTMAHNINQRVSKSALVTGFPPVFKLSISCFRDATLAVISAKFAAETVICNQELAEWPLRIW